MAALGLVGDDLRPGHVLAVLGVVRDRVVHVGDAALVHQVDDQLQLVQALEVGHLRRVAGFDVSVSKPALISSDAPPHSTACSPNRSVSVSSRKDGLDHAGLAAAVGRGVAQRQIARLARTCRHARRSGAARRRLACRCRAPVWPGALGATIQTSRSARGIDLAVVHVEAVRERQRSALLDVGLDVVACRPRRSARRAAGSSRRRRS